MLSKSPAELKKLNSKQINRQILRLGIIAELDAVSLYEQLASETDDPIIKDVLLDIAKEEKTHVGEFQALLLKLDQEQAEELKEGQEEVDEIAKK